MGTNGRYEGNMTMRAYLAIVAAPALLAAACTSTGNVERNAAAGAGVGALIGGVIGNNYNEGDAKEGAAIGAAIGGLAGAARGAQQDNAQVGGTTVRQPAAGQQLIYDTSAGRYYYRDYRTGLTYWRNGELRG